MALIPWRPFEDLDKMFGDEDWLFPIFPRVDSVKPAMDVYETDKSIVAEVSIPNFDPEKIDVSVKDGILRIRGQMEEKKEDDKKGYWRREIRKGSFERAVRLPVSVKEDGVEATYEKGVLKITVPKAEAKAAPRIQVKMKGD